jgi:hypothetical protein
METSQRMHTMTAEAVKKYLASLVSRGQASPAPDKYTPCIVDSDHANTACSDFWTCRNDVAEIFVCTRHQRAHPCFVKVAADGPYCSRCNHDGVCPISCYPELRRFERRDTSNDPALLSDEAILRDYALEFNITSHLRSAPARMCSSACRDWWPHPSGTIWVCSSHHRVHHCATTCEFIGKDNGNSDCTACPVSGLLGRNAPVHSSRRVIRRSRGERTVGGLNDAIALSPQWILQCVSYVMRETSLERLRAWSSVIWTLLCVSALNEHRNHHQLALNAVIGLLTTIPMKAIVVKGVVLIPMLPYLTHTVPGKLLTTVTAPVKMTTSKYTVKGHCHTIVASMGSPHNATVALNKLYAALDKLTVDRLSLLKIQLGSYFCDPLAPADPPASLFE